MIALLFNVPKSQQDWDAWSFANRTAVKNIRNLIQVKYGVNLKSYQLDPINFSDVAGFLDRNQQTHIEFNQVLGLSSTDLQDVDLTNESQLRAWIFENAKEVENAQNALNN
jgi:hypothetical protein